MLHTYDGQDIPKDGAKWAGDDGLHDDGLRDPEEDCTSVGLRENDGKDEVHPSHIARCPRGSPYQVIHVTY